MATVKRPIATLLVLQHIDGEQERVKVHLRYNPADPFAVQLDFGLDKSGDRNVWTFSRSILADAFSSPAGFGDVRCWTSGARLYITLSNGNDTATFECLADVVRGFLIDAEDLVAFGAEELDVDAAVAALLKGAR